MKQKLSATIILRINSLENKKSPLQSTIQKWLRADPQLSVALAISENRNQVVRDFLGSQKSVSIVSNSTQSESKLLNQAIKKSTGDLLLFLSDRSIPSAKWLDEMRLTLSQSDIAVGNTVPVTQKRPTPYASLAVKLFSKRSERAARASGFALPWGPINNLGIRRSLIEEVGFFSESAGNALDRDWCWRALLRGFRLEFAPKASIALTESDSRELLIHQLEEIGKGEAWLHRNFSFLTGESISDPLLLGIEGYKRLRYGVKVPKSLEKPLEEAAIAFASGLRIGYESALDIGSEMRNPPSQPIGWESGKGEYTVFVYGKGLTSFKGKPLQIWQALQAGAKAGELAELFQKIYRLPKADAIEEANSFLEMLKPSKEPIETALEHSH